MSPKIFVGFDVSQFNGAVSEQVVVERLTTVIKNHDFCLV